MSAVCLGVDHKTVGAVRGRMVSSGEIASREKTIGADGRLRGKPSRDIPTELKTALFDAGLGDTTVILRNSVARHGPELYIAKGLSESEIEAWSAYRESLIAAGNSDDGAAAAVDWLVRNGWKSPEEWMGDDGISFRERFGWGKHRRRKQKAATHAN